MINVEKHNKNSINLTDCADINISNYMADGLIATAIDAGYSTYFSDNAAGVFIAATNAGYLTDCADINI